MRIWGFCARANARREGADDRKREHRAIEHLHRHGICVVGGLIVGSPADTRESIDANLAFRGVMWTGRIQHPRRPRHADDRDFRDAASSWTKTCALRAQLDEVRTEHLPAGEIEFLRWRAERWMKVRHMPAAFAHSPGFVLRHGLEMLAHTFTGTSLRSVFGLESDAAVFARFRESRQSDREYLRLEPHEVQPAAVNQAA
jgi:hypothetical protein